MKCAAETCDRGEFGECGSKIEECATCSYNDGGGDNDCDCDCDDGGGGNGDVLIMVVMGMVIMVPMTFRMAGPRCTGLSKRSISSASNHCWTRKRMSILGAM